MICHEIMVDIQKLNLLPFTTFQKGRETFLFPIKVSTKGLMEIFIDISIHSESFYCLQTLSTPVYMFSVCCNNSIIPIKQAQLKWILDAKHLRYSNQKPKIIDNTIFSFTPTCKEFPPYIYKIVFPEEGWLVNTVVLLLWLFFL